MKLEVGESRNAVLSICSANYAFRAAVTLQTYLSVHPGHSAILLLVDRKKKIRGIPGQIRVVWVEDLNIEGFLTYAFQYDVLELNTNVKPFVLRLLLADYNQVVYLDPDICVYRTLTPVFEALRDGNVVVTPHCLSPLPEGGSPSDIELLKFGSFNLGFVAVRRSDETLRFLDWWSARCLSAGFYEPQSGLAVDQKWVELAPCYFEGVVILRHLGLNVAFWNLHERRIGWCNGTAVVNGDIPLYFFHFSSFDPEHPEVIANKQDHYAPGTRADFESVSRPYAALLKENRSVVSCDLVYGFDAFDDGVNITAVLRRVYASNPELKKQTSNPFAAAGPVRRFAEHSGLLDRGAAAVARRGRGTFKDLQAFAVQRRALEWLFGVGLRILGPRKYYDLMRFLAYFSSIRNQSGIFEARIAKTRSSSLKVL